ncbi:MAG: 7-cyano-7-deazaguanine synthase [Candidatus Nanoarchaeia archaeon]|nr:7-cyano-7-deazaguanine synthase [Candidatus Nanoarchaeia archaeon]
MNNAIILCSGGLDSTAVAYKVKSMKPKKMMLLFFNYNQKPLKEERFCVKKIASELKAEFKEIDLRWLGEISTSLINRKEKIPRAKEENLKNIRQEQENEILYWVPCRNAVFGLIGLSHAESLFISTKERWDVYLGIKDEGQVQLKDTTPEFLEKLNLLGEEATFHGGYKILAPFIDKDKPEVVEIGTKLKVPWEYTYSCYSGGGFKKNKPVHCGKCHNCLLRKKAFHFSEAKDVSLYLD